jgi:aspartyl protease family protein
MRVWNLCFAVALATASAVCASAEVVVHALATDRALISVDQGKPKMLRTGEVYQGVKLISATPEFAIVEIQGKRRRVTFGDAVTTGAGEAGGQRTTLVSDAQGHFFTTGTINGAVVRFLVDTGATTVAMDADAARRAGIKYLEGERAYSTTANGLATVYRVKLQTVRVGDITLHDIDGAVHETASLPVVLLGMSFLGRLDMRREGDTMTLIRKY